MTVRKILPPVLLALVLLPVYLMTMAPGLTWANDGADGGDLITAAATGGVAHPTGYPVYLLIASLFQRLPLGTLAFRTNLLSAVAAVIAAVLVYGILVWLPDSPVQGNSPAGMIAGFLFGLAPIIWSQAVITEVYTLHVAFVAWVVFLVLWSPTPVKPAWLDGLRGLVLGLAAGNHLTAVLLIPAVALSGSWKDRWKFDGRALLRMAAGLVTGLLVYLVLPLRALSKAPVNWGNPVTVPQFLWLVTGELYQRRLLAIPVAGILQRLQEMAGLLLRQFELPGIFLALIGLLFFFKPNRLYFITIWNAVVFSVFAVLYASFDSYLYLIPVIFSIAIWTGLGFGGLVNEKFAYFPGFKTAVVVVFLILLAGLVEQRWGQVDARNDVRAEQFGAQVMSVAPQNAILFTQDDQAIFALWYFHFALGQRPDLTIVVTDLLHFQWYADILQFTYPMLDWPGGYLLWTQTIIAANPARPACFISYREQASIDCGAVP